MGTTASKVAARRVVLEAARERAAAARAREAAVTAVAVEVVAALEQRAASELEAARAVARLTRELGLSCAQVAEVCPGLTRADVVKLRRLAEQPSGAAREDGAES